MIAVDQADKTKSPEIVETNEIDSAQGEVWFDSSGMHYADESFASEPFKEEGAKFQDEIMTGLESDFEPEAEVGLRPESVLEPERKPGKVAENSPEDDPELIAASKKKRQYNFPQISLPKNHSYSLLVFETGSFGLRGALVKNTKHAAILGAVAASTNVDFTRAIAEVLLQLKQHQKHLPRKAVLLTPSVVSSLLELPVSPLRPRPDSEMQELIRWDLEGIINQQNKCWLIGAMLIERGYLSAAQRDELVTELQVRLTQGSTVDVIRFGDLAVEFGYITPAQMEECFVLQGKLTAEDDDLVFGWRTEEIPVNSAPTDEALLSKDDDRESAHEWLVSGMSKGIRHRWVGAFALNNIHLEILYSSVGASYAALPSPVKDDAQVLLEIHQENLALIVGGLTGVQQFRSQERLQGDLHVDEISALLRDIPDNIKTVYINAFGRNIDDLLFTLRAELPFDYEVLSLQGLSINLPDTLHIDKLLGMAGVAGHYFEHVSKARLSPIAARDKEPTIIEKLMQPKVLLSLTGVLVFVAMSGFIAWMHWNTSVQEARLLELKGNYDRDVTLKSQYSRIKGEQSLLKERITYLLKEQALNQKILDAAILDKPRQRVALAVLMKSISVNTPQGVNILVIRRLGKETEIEAEAVTQTESLEFVNGLNKQLEPLAFQVKNSRIYQKDDAESRSNSSQVAGVGLPYRVELVVLEGNALSHDEINSLMVNENSASETLGSEEEG